LTHGHVRLRRRDVSVEVEIRNSPSTVRGPARCEAILKTEKPRSLRPPWRDRRSERGSAERYIVSSEATSLAPPIRGCNTAERARFWGAYWLLTALYVAELIAVLIVMAVLR
jgi:hypothetical protein